MSRPPHAPTPLWKVDNSAEVGLRLLGMSLEGRTGSLIGVGLAVGVEVLVRATVGVGLEVATLFDTVTLIAFEPSMTLLELNATADRMCAPFAALVVFQL